MQARPPRARPKPECALGSGREPRVRRKAPQNLEASTQLQDRRIQLELEVQVGPLASRHLCSHDHLQARRIRPPRFPRRKSRAKRRRRRARPNGAASGRSSSLPRENERSRLLVRVRARLPEKAKAKATSFGTIRLRRKNCGLHLERTRVDRCCVDVHVLRAPLTHTRSHRHRQSCRQWCRRAAFLRSRRCSTSA